jgi:hypothetical protein
VPHTVRMLAVLLVAALVLPTAAHAQSGNGNNPRTTDQNQTVECDNGDVTFEGPERMWPPNHKLFPASLTFSPGEDGNPYSYMAETAHNQVEDDMELNGSGNTPWESDFAFVDDDGSTQTMIAGMDEGDRIFPMQVRAERSGRDKDGRTYTLRGMVTFGENGMPCDFEFSVHVPHDQGQRNGAATGSRADAMSLRPSL